MKVDLKDVQEDFKRYQYEIDELRANNNELRKNLRDACMYLACTVDVSKYNESLTKTPSQSLADIKAEAIVDLINVMACSAAVDGIATSVIYVDGATNYANKLKEG